MAFRRKTETTSSSSATGKLRKTMPTRFAAGDERAPEDGPTYQGSRGGWFPEPHKPVPGTPQN
ncbi:hypothetical protein ACFQ9H_19455 [Streptomyces sp. NPDC056517]|uniref:hypothetical protein n=1 Tax=Streptomyces sp. NPDC056517 TaxID=3345848 RepID=UPI0036CE7384